MIIKPQPGFQESVLSCTADIAITGGAAGCGKSWASVVDPMRWVHLSNYHGIIFRRTHQQLKGGDSIWEESLGLYPSLQGKANHSDYLWKFPSGATVKFGHLQHQKNKYDHQGMSYATIIFEELTHFEEDQWWYLYSRNRSKSGVRPYMRGTCNPDSESFVADLIAWYIDDNGLAIPERCGKIRWFVRENGILHWASDRSQLMHYCDLKDPHDRPSSFTYLQGYLDDNKILMDVDPSYKTKLKRLPLVERERLLGGNWKIKPAAGLYFRSEYYTIVEAPPCSIKRCVRFWDKAATEKKKDNDPSYTVGALICLLEDDRIYVQDIVRLQGEPGKVDRAMRATATKDGPDVVIGMFQDPGQAGKVDVKHTKRILEGYTVRPYKVAKNKVAMAGPVSARAESDGILLKKAPWNNEYITEHCNFPDGKKNDQVDATSGGYQLVIKQPLYFA